MQSLDNILSGQGEAVSAQETKENEQVTQVATEGESQSEQQAEGQSSEGEGGDRQKMVPHEALHAEKQKVKRYTEEVADFRRSNEALQRRIDELMQRIPVPRQEQPEPTDFFADPDKALNERLQSHLGQAFGPVQQQLIAQAQMLAGIKYGDDKVAAAEEAFLAAGREGRLDPADYQRVINSPNRYAEAVKWHQRQQAQAEIGDDPVAYRAKVEAELEAKVREKVLAELQQGQQAQQRTVMPSNLIGARNVGARTGPAWSGPTPLADIFKV